MNKAVKWKWLLLAIFLHLCFASGVLVTLKEYIDSRPIVTRSQTFLVMPTPNETPEPNAKPERKQNKPRL